MHSNFFQNLVNAFLIEDIIKCPSVLSDSEQTALCQDVDLRNKVIPSDLKENVHQSVRIKIQLTKMISFSM